MCHPHIPDYQWAIIVFSDEGRPNLSYYDGHVKVWRTHCERFLPGCLSQTQKKHHPIFHCVGVDRSGVCDGSVYFCNVLISNVLLTFGL